MAEEKKTQVIIDEEAFKDEESAYPGTPLSDITKGQIKAMEDCRKEHGSELNYPPIHSGYGHMSTTQLLTLAKARKSVTIPNPNVNPQWSEIMDDAYKFAATISVEDDPSKIQAALHKFIDVEDSHSKFIRRAMANDILRSEIKRRVKSTKIVVDEEKLKVGMDDPEDKSLKEYLNNNFGNPYKKILNMDLNSKYVMYEKDEE